MQNSAPQHGLPLAAPVGRQSPVAGIAGPFRQFRFFGLAALALCLVSVPLACSLGPLGLSFGDVFRVLVSLPVSLFTPDASLSGQGGQIIAVSPEGARQVLDAATLHLVVADLRLPRVLLALLAGAGLAVAGSVFQGILRNPLADPFTLGVSSGAAFGAALAISLGLTGAAVGFGLPVAAFAGAGIALAAVLFLGRIGGGLRRETLVLAGVVVSAFLAALIALVKALDEASVTGIVFWIMGSFQGRGWAEVILLLPGVAGGCAVAFLLTRELDILALGDTTARHLGLGAVRIRLLLLVAASAITASCVAVSGIIGFIGLVVPHLCRLLLGAGHLRLLPAAALCGGLLLLWSDVAARTVLPGGVELPVGVITALLGGPFFCFILGKKQSPQAGGCPLPDSGSAAKVQQESGELAHWQSFSPVVHGDASAPVHVKITGLGLGYGKGQAPVLRDFSLSLRQGEFTGLLGPNGSGKSSLLHCISGVLPSSGGHVHVSGQDIAALTEKARAHLLATLSQKPEAVPALSAFELALMGRYAHTPFLGGYSQADREATRQALAETGAGHLAFRSAAALSGGELQRVLLARALVQQTPLLLLDEATAGLDPACQISVLDALIRRNQRDGLTIFAALHDLNLAALYCHRLIFLKQGRIVADGTVQEVFTPEVLSEVYETPATLVPHPVTGHPQALLQPCGVG